MNDQNNDITKDWQRALESEKREFRARLLKKAKEKAKEKIKEKVKEKLIKKGFSKIGPWILTGGAEAAPLVGGAPIWTLKALHSYLKAEKKGLALLIVIIAACVDLFGMVSVQFFSKIDWIGDIVMTPLMIILDFYAGEEESES